MSNEWNEPKITTKESWAGDHNLPSTLLIDYSEEGYIGVVGTREYANKATDYFSDFYGGHITDKKEKFLHKKRMKKKVIEQIQCILDGKSLEQGLDVIGVWMSKDILFPQILEAHQKPVRKPDLVELYNHIHGRKKT